MFAIGKSTRGAGPGPAVSRPGPYILSLGALFCFVYAAIACCEKERTEEDEFAPSYAEHPPTVYYPYGPPNMVSRSVGIVYYASPPAYGASPPVAYGTTPAQPINIQQPGPPAQPIVQQP